MLSVDLMSLWANQVDEISKGIDEATLNIFNYLKYREKNKYNSNLLEELLSDILIVLKYWVENTYIGNKKDTIIEISFQNFFVKFMELLMYFKNGILTSDEEKAIANKCLFRGNVYRYLGHDDPNGKNEKVKLNYNEIYVSWSKLDKITYIESKLYGWITFVSCEIKKPYYGIDLEAIGISKPHEKEVVFPTIKELIKNIKYKK